MNTILHSRQSAKAVLSLDIDVRGDVIFRIRAKVELNLEYDFELKSRMPSWIDIEGRIGTQARLQFVYGDCCESDVIAYVQLCPRMLLEVWLSDTFD